MKCEEKKSDIPEPDSCYRKKVKKILGFFAWGGGGLLAGVTLEAAGKRVWTLGMSRFIRILSSSSDSVIIIGIVLIFLCVLGIYGYKYALENKKLDLEKSKVEHEIEMDTPEERDKQRQHEENLLRIKTNQQNLRKKKGRNTTEENNKTDDIS